MLVYTAKQACATIPYRDRFKSRATAPGQVLVTNGRLKATGCLHRGGSRVVAEAQVR